MRPLDYWLIATKSIRRQPLRSTLTLSALILSTAVVMLMAGLSLGGYQATYGQFENNDMLQTVTVTSSQTTDSLNPFGSVSQVGTQKQLNDATVAQLAGSAHVVKASPRAALWEIASFTVDHFLTRFNAQAVGIPSDADMQLIAGTGFVSNDDQNKVIVGYGFAKALNTPPKSLVGRTIQLTTQLGYRGIDAAIPDPNASKQAVDTFNNNATTLAATIVGVTQPGQDQNGIYIPMGWAHEIRTLHYYDNNTLKTTDQLARDGYNSIQLSVDSLSHVQSVADEVKSLGYGETSLLATVQQVNQLLMIVTIILGMVAIIALLAATLGVINTMLMAVSEQAFEIGILRACGAKKGTILMLFLTQSIILGFCGGVIGVCVSLPLGVFLTHYGASLLVEQGLQSVDLVVFSPLVSLGAVALTVIFCILAGIYPAFRAANLDPSKVLSSQ